MNNKLTLITIGLIAVACARQPDTQVIYQNTPAAGASIVEMIDPCGDHAIVANEEVLLRLSDGRVLVSFTSGGKAFLSVLQPGNYVTTDGTNCHFTLTPEGEVAF